MRSMLVRLASGAGMAAAGVVLAVLALEYWRDRER